MIFASTETIRTRLLSKSPIKYMYKHNGERVKSVRVNIVEKNLLQILASIGIYRDGGVYFQKTKLMIDCQLK